MSIPIACEVSSAAVKVDELLESMHLCALREHIVWDRETWHEVPLSGIGSAGVTCRQL